MKCENLQFNLSFFADDILSAEESKQVERHLETCPLCRSKFAEYQTLKNDFRSFSRPEIPSELVFSIKKAIAAELNRPKKEPFFSNSFLESLQYRVMPIAVGTIVSFFLGFSLLLTLLSTREATQEGVQKAHIQSNRTVVLMAANSNPGFGSVPSNDLSDLELPVAIETPTFNPAGALMALSKSIVRGKMKDEEVVVVADVFGNGVAKIAEVVEAPRDRRAMHDLERALSEDPSYAPFVTANQDKRSDIVRVVLKIQRVDVREESPSPKKMKF